MEKRTEVRGISLPTDLMREIRQVEQEREARGELGGFSAAARELMLAGLQQRKWAKSLEKPEASA